MENLNEIWPCDFTTSEEVKLREIEVSKCENIANMFPCNPMPLLQHLEILKVRDCGSIEALFNTVFDKGNISLRKIEVIGCGKLVNLFPCNPMPFLHHLEELQVDECGSIEELFNIHLDCVAADEKGSISLKKIKVFRCDKLVNLLLCNPMPLLHHLEELEVEKCGSIETLLNIDIDCVGETGEGRSSSLRRIQVEKLGKLQEVWRIKDANHSHFPIRGFQAVESISISSCERFRNVYSPTSTNFDLGALTYMSISDSVEIRRKYGLVESSLGKENTLFPTCLIHLFHNLRKLELDGSEGVEVIFEI
ncbi:unnamed protein product [Lactuca saligna]|uniref:Disease resistance protein At4g27190-like leucine-rich repeats domain-containing protein n=1 Tax=Lactuca saligna TaxID=75948 RepID=A0AA35YDX2_LACSI|nr:unnamed protein product [Lactuca saligna]